jgi:hypothetical protein
MQLIDDLREAANQLEKEAELIQEAKDIVKEFAGHYPFGINPDLDAAYGRARDLLRKVGEL